MVKGKVVSIGQGIGLSILTYLLLLCFWALLLVNAVVPEEHANVLVIASGGIAAFLGGRFSARKGGGLPAAAGSTCGFVAVVFLLGYLIFDSVSMQGWIFLSVGILCGCAAGMGKVGKKKRKKRRRRS